MFLGFSAALGQNNRACLFRAAHPLEYGCERAIGQARVVRGDGLDRDLEVGRTSPLIVRVASGLSAARSGLFESVPEPLSAVLDGVATNVFRFFLIFLLLLG